jgi:hypothetical protein
MRERAVLRYPGFGLPLPPSKLLPSPRVWMRAMILSSDKMGQGER